MQFFRFFLSLNQKVSSILIERASANESPKIAILRVFCDLEILCSISLKPLELIFTIPSPSLLQTPELLGSNENPLTGSYVWNIGYSIFNILKKISKNKIIKIIKKKKKKFFFLNFSQKF